MGRQRTPKSRIHKRGKLYVVNFQCGFDVEIKQQSVYEYVRKIVFHEECEMYFGFYG